uniref:Uncharacterized protein n=1 Tax=Rhodosorus marinus TaxID=101924 RepID=A0A7S0BJ97_9RHOD
MVNIQRGRERGRERLQCILVLAIKFLLSNLSNLSTSNWNCFLRMRVSLSYELPRLRSYSTERIWCFAVPHKREKVPSTRALIDVKTRHVRLSETPLSTPIRDSPRDVASPSQARAPTAFRISNLEVRDSPLSIENALQRSMKFKEESVNAEHLWHGVYR